MEDTLFLPIGYEDDIDTTTTTGDSFTHEDYIMPENRNYYI